MTEQREKDETQRDRSGMRCFLFTYVWTGKTQQGNGNLWLCRDKFPAQMMLKEAAKNACPEAAEIVITGWNEFASVADYDAFVDESPNAPGKPPAANELNEG